MNNNSNTPSHVPTTTIDLARFARAFDHVDLDRLVELITYQDTHSAKALAQLDEHLEVLDELLADLSTEQALDRFLATADSFDERADRWALLHTAEAVAGFKPQLSAWPGWAHPDPHMRARPLRPLELGAVRTLARARRNDRAVIAVALGEMGADTAELPLLTGSSLSVGPDGQVSGVSLPGRERTGAGPRPVSPRHAAIPAWALPAFQRRREIIGDDESLLYEGRSTVTHRMISTLLMDMRKTMDLSGHDGCKIMKPRSIRNGAALERYEDGAPVEVIAAQLGIDDFGRMQELLGLRSYRPRRRRANTATNPGLTDASAA